MHLTYREQILVSARNALKDISYKEAISILEDSFSVIGNDQVIEDAIAEVVFLETNNYIENGDIIGAIEYLKSKRNSMVNDGKAERKLQELHLIYREHVLISAKNALKDIGYKEAISILEDSFSVIGNDQVIEDTILDYSKYAPVRLEDLDVWQKNEPIAAWGGIGPHVENVTDNVGNLYRVVFYNLYSGSYNVYRINGAYSKFYAVYFIPYKLNSTTEGSRLVIYGDDKVIYSDEMTGGYEPINVCVDITGVKLLKIYMYTYHWNGIYAARLGDAYLVNDSYN